MKTVEEFFQKWKWRRSSGSCSGSGSSSGVLQLLALQFYWKMFIDIRNSLVIAFSLLILCKSTFFANPPDFDFNENCQRAYHEILHLRLEKGNSILLEELKANPNNGVVYYLFNYYDFFKLMINEDKILFEKLEKNLDERLEKLESLDKNSPYFLFTQGEIHLQWSFIKFKYGESFSSMYHFKKAYNFLSENEKKYASFLPQKRTLGVLHILVSLVPEDYQWIINFLGFKGTRNQGLAEITLTMNDNSVFRMEATMLYASFLAFLEIDEKKAQFLLEKNYSQNPDNLIAFFALAFLYKNTGKNEKCLELLSKRNFSKDYIEFEYLTYMTAECFLRSGNYISAIKYYQLFMKNHKNLNYIKDSQYKISLSYWLDGKEKDAFIEKDKIAQTGRNTNYWDKRAQQFVKEKKFPNRTLTKSRLLFDGGYYSTAEKILIEDQSFLTEKIPYTSEEKSEYFYRLGRIYQKQELYEQAIKYFNITITIKYVDKLPYYIPYSNYQLAEIYYTKGDFKNSKLWAGKALTYKDFEHSEGLKYQVLDLLRKMN